GGAVHAGHPPTANDFGLGDVLQVHHTQKVIGESVHVRCYGGVASTGPPQAVDAQAWDFQEGDFFHRGGTGDVVNAQAGAEFLAVGDAVGQGVFEIAANVVV